MLNKIQTFCFITAIITVDFGLYCAFTVHKFLPLWTIRNEIIYCDNFQYLFYSAFYIIGKLSYLKCLMTEKGFLFSYIYGLLSKRVAIPATNKWCIMFQISIWNHRRACRKSKWDLWCSDSFWSFRTCGVDRSFLKHVCRDNQGEMLLMLQQMYS